MLVAKGYNLVNAGEHEAEDNAYVEDGNKKCDDDDDEGDDDDEEEEEQEEVDDDEEIDRRGDGCPVFSDTLEQRGEPAFLHLNSIIIIILGRGGSQSSCTRWPPPHRWWNKLG